MNHLQSISILCLGSTLLASAADIAIPMSVFGMAETWQIDDKTVEPVDGALVLPAGVACKVTWITGRRKESALVIAVDRTTPDQAPAWAWQGAAPTDVAGRRTATGFSGATSLTMAISKAEMDARVALARSLSSATTVERKETPTAGGQEGDRTARVSSTETVSRTTTNATLADTTVERVITVARDAVDQPAIAAAAKLPILAEDRHVVGRPGSPWVRCWARMTGGLDEDAKQPTPEEQKRNAARHAQARAEIEKAFKDLDDLVDKELQRNPEPSR